MTWAVGGVGWSHSLARRKKKGLWRRAPARKTLTNWSWWFFIMLHRDWSFLYTRSDFSMITPTSFPTYYHSSPFLTKCICFLPSINRCDIIEFVWYYRVYVLLRNLCDIMEFKWYYRATVLIHNDIYITQFVWWFAPPGFSKRPPRKWATKLSYKILMSLKLIMSLNEPTK